MLFMNDFMIGDRVIYVSDESTAGLYLEGREGIIKEVQYDDDLLGVSWENLTTGHTLNGTLTKRSGWYVRPGNVKRISQINKEEYEGRTIVYKVNKQELLKIFREKTLQDEDYND